VEVMFAIMQPLSVDLRLDGLQAIARLLGERSHSKPRVAEVFVDLVYASVAVHVNIHREVLLNCLGAKAIVDDRRVKVIVKVRKVKQDVLSSAIEVVKVLEEVESKCVLDVTGQ
jgi:hypothetical protein